MISEMTIDELSLTHFGKKGMKWGVRNASSNQAGTSVKKSHHLRNALLLASGTAAVAILVEAGFMQHKMAEITDRANDITDDLVGPKVATGPSKATRDYLRRELPANNRHGGNNYEYNPKAKLDTSQIEVRR